MTDRTLTITLRPGRRAAGSLAAARAHHGETLNFETPAQFFSRLTERRWTLLNALPGQGEVGVRELARRVGRDVKRVHEDIEALAALGLVERTQRGGVVCPFAQIHIDMHLRVTGKMGA